MIEQFLAPENLPFAVALAMMIFLGFIEGIGMVIGLGVSDLLDGFLPDIDADIDIEVDADIDGGPEVSLTGHGVEVGHLDQIGPFTRTLSWLRIGRVPILVLVVLFLMAFGLGGLILQLFVASVLGGPLPTWIAVVPALVFGFSSMNVLGGLAEKIIPKDETSSISRDDFVGRIATITIGKARRGSSAEARLRDQYKQAHYVMIEPDLDGVEFEQGQEVLIVRREGSIYRAIENSNAALVNGDE